MSTLCITALPPGDAARRRRLCRLAADLAGEGETFRLLLYGDGVFNLVSGSEAAADLSASPAEILALAEDIAARGLAARIVPEARGIDYAEAVRLIMESDRTLTGA